MVSMQGRTQGNEKGGTFWEEISVKFSYPMMPHQNDNWCKWSFTHIGTAEFKFKFKNVIFLALIIRDWTTRKWMSS